MERAFYEIVAGQNARIAALEAQIARLTAPISRTEAAEVVCAYDTLTGRSDADDMREVLTAFLERRMKG